MIASYDKYQAMSDEQLQREIYERRVTVEYLNWLGIAGKGAILRAVIKEI